MATFHRQWCILREDSKEHILFSKAVIKSNVKANMVSLLVDKCISFHEFLYYSIFALILTTMASAVIYCFLVRAT